MKTKGYYELVRAMHACAQALLAVVMNTQYELVRVQGFYELV